MSTENLVEKAQEPWDIVTQFVHEENTEALNNFFSSLSRSEKALVVSRLDEDIHDRVIANLTTEVAAELMEDVYDEQAAELLDDLSPEKAAAIVDEMASDEQADVLGQLERSRAEAILCKMTPSEAEHTRRLLRSPKNTAGGIMVTEFLAYKDSEHTKDVIRNLRKHGEEYSDHDVHYLYITSRGKLIGVLSLWKLLCASKETLLMDLALQNPICVSEDTSLEDLKHLIDQYNFITIPVVDNIQGIIGIVRRKSILEAIKKMDNRAFLNFSGIVGGEELRSMPLLLRSFRRLSWLTVNIVLNIISASVIFFYQDILVAAISLAVFLPIISDMSGCSGNQAIAVSIRELSIGQIKSYELLRVLFKEAQIGIINGLVLGFFLGGVAFLWKQNMYFGLVVGASLALNSFLSACLGGAIPLLLRRYKMDPALASSPILTTITDMVGFFLVLNFASWVLPKLSGM